MGCTGSPASRSATRMPSANPTCASCRVGIRSPTAEMVSTLVRHSLVDEDVAAVELDAGFGVPEAVGDRTAADGDEQQLGGRWSCRPPG